MKRGTPLPRFGSLGELLAYAAALERRAARRYRHLAEQMRARGRPDLAELFDRLAREEEGHEAWVKARSNLGQGEPEPDVGGEEPVPDEDLTRASTYACLAAAVRGEQKAFEFFSYVAADSDDPEIKSMAEDLAHQELQHAALLRRARRRAYREVKQVASRWPRAREIESLDHLLAAAARGEARILAAISRDADRLDVLADLQRLARERLPPLGLSLEGPPPVEDQGGAAATGDEEILRAALDQAEAAFEFYDAVATSAADEQVLLTAQAFTAFALDRLRRLRGVSAG